MSVTDVKNPVPTEQEATLALYIFHRLIEAYYGGVNPPPPIQPEIEEKLKFESGLELNDRIKTADGMHRRKKR